MRNEIIVNGQTIKVGDCYKVRPGTLEAFGCSAGNEVRIVNIDASGNIGLESKKAVDGWHNLDGRVSDCHGYWLSVDHLLEHFIKKNSSRTKIGNSFVFKNQDLKGKYCQIIAYFSNCSYAFVEFEEDIGGGSADGMGRNGHCVAVPTEIIVEENKSNARRKHA